VIVAGFIIAVALLGLLLSVNFALMGHAACELFSVGMALAGLFVAALTWKWIVNATGLGLPWTVASYPVTDLAMLAFLLRSLRRPAMWKYLLIASVTFQLCTHVVYWALISAGEDTPLTHWRYVLVSNVGFAGQLALIYGKGLADGFRYLRRRGALSRPSGASHTSAFSR
jgi:hypothetical protein